MDFIKAVSIIGRDLEEAIALLDKLAAEGGSNIAEIELARLRVRSATELLRLLPGLNRVMAPGPAKGARNEEQVINITGTQTTVEPVMPAAGPQLTGETVILSDMPRTELNAGTQTTAEPVILTDGPQATTEPVILTDVPQMTADPVIQTVGPMTMEVPAAKIAGAQKTQDPQKPILADRFASTGTFGEKMQSTKQEGAISSVMHNKPIADIGAAIGMNDKFYFIRELFSGDTIAYHETIVRLNAAASLGEAMKILDESTVMGSDPSAQSSFVDVVRRKFNIHV